MHPEWKMSRSVSFGRFSAVRTASVKSSHRKASDAFSSMLIKLTAVGMANPDS